MNVLLICQSDLMHRPPSCDAHTCTYNHKPSTTHFYSPLLTDASLKDTFIWHLCLKYDYNCSFLDLTRPNNVNIHQISIHHKSLSLKQPQSNPQYNFWWPQMGIAFFWPMVLVNQLWPGVNEFRRNGIWNDGRQTFPT